MEKKYFWFKMDDDFFYKKEIKKLRSIAGGDTFVIIYLKLILMSLKNGGKIYYEGFENNIIEELALTIDEKLENVKITFTYLVTHNIIITDDNQNFFINDILPAIGSKTSTALRVQKHREKHKALQCNGDVTQVKQIDNGEIELDLETDKELNINIDNPVCIKKSNVFIIPTLEEVEVYIKERNIYYFTAQQFIDYYTARGWLIGKNKMKDWKAAIRTWENNHKQKESEKVQV